MCFSAQADIVAGVALLPVAVLALREVRCRRELPFAALPLLFAMHQLIEAFVWAGVHGDVTHRVQAAATFGYLLIAFPLLPILLPVAVLLLEPQGRRARVAPFVVLGAVVAAYLGWAVLAHPISVVEHPHALEYVVGLDHGYLWSGLYVIAVIGPSVLSGYPSIVAFGFLNLLGLITAGVLYEEVFASLWCVYAAMLSVLVLVHMVRRRKLPDPHRLQGHTLTAARGTAAPSATSS